MDKKIESFEQLEVWKVARELRCSISQLTKTFPKDEKYMLTQQITRSARSVSANIVEDFGRFHYQENIQFCRQARGSLLETAEHLICALDENYIDQSAFDSYRELTDKCGKLLNGYIAYLKKAAQASKSNNQ